jgi:protein phosphatase
MGRTTGRTDVSLELHWGARTDTGLRRKRNEDAYVAEPPVFAVADGMGGHARGDVAAAMAVEALRNLLADQEPDAAPIQRSVVLDEVRNADQAIHQAGSDLTAAGMGTTVCGIVPMVDEVPPSALVFNVGDSRVYLHRHGTLHQVSRDHSVVQELLDAGQIDSTEAELHPQRNVVTRSLGSGEPLDIDWWNLELLPGDRWLLCSDGLVKEVQPSRLVDLLRSDVDAQQAADRLVQLALDGGGRDNITVVVVDVSGELPHPATDLDAGTNPRQTSVATQPRREAPTAPLTRSYEEEAPASP